MIVKLKDAEGNAVLVNTDNVAVVSHVKTNGKLVIGKVALVCVGTTIVVDGTLEEIYGLLRRGERVLTDRYGYAVPGIKGGVIDGNDA